MTDASRRSAKSSPGETSSPLNLEQQRKRAKDLLRQFRRGGKKQPLAIQRFARHLPRTQGLSQPAIAALSLTLSEAQLVIAREGGFPSWPRMKLAIEVSKSEAGRLTALIQAAVHGQPSRVRALLDVDPGLPTRSLHAACALGDRRAALELLECRPSEADQPGGPYSWTPLLYTTCAGLAANESSAEPRIGIATKLLQLGADSTVFAEDSRLPQGARTPLSGAIRYVKSAELLERLLNAGAARTERLWNTSMVGHAAELDDIRCLELLLPLRPPSWEMRGALSVAVLQHRLPAIALLLKAGADPNSSGVWGSTGTVVHDAILARCDSRILEALREKGANLADPDRDGRTPWQIAFRTDNEAAVDFLHQHGFNEEPHSIDQLLQAAFQGDANRVSSLRSASPDPARHLRRTDHQLLSWAIRQRREEIVPLLLRAGLDPTVPDDEGDLPLGLAARRGNPHLVRRLLEHGAEASDADLNGRTPLEQALLGPDTAKDSVVDALHTAGADAHKVSNIPADESALSHKLRVAGAVERDDLTDSFERAADAIVNGDREVLVRLLQDEPSLCQARSLRPHRATLLHYLGANGLEEHRQKTPQNAVEIMQCLLEAGSVPDALARTYGGGPAQTTMALLASSSHPADANLQGALIRTLVAGGANPDGLDHDGLPMATAVAFRCRQAVDALVDLIHQSNVVFAAAAGQVELLATQMGSQGRLRDGFDHCRVPWLHMSRDPQRAAQQALVAAAQFGRLEVVEFLLQQGVDGKDAPLDNGVTALHEACFFGDRAVVERLLDHGANPGQRENLYRSTALGWAREGRHEEVFALLLERHEPDFFDSVEFNLVQHARSHLERDASQVDAPEGRGNLLRYAARTGMTAMVELLLEKGADRALADDVGRTALDFAKDEGHDEIVSLLSSS